MTDESVDVAAEAAGCLEKELWPVAIMQDRCQGVHAGGRWVAIPHADRADLDRAVWSDDVSWAIWAEGHIVRGRRVGVGDTPQEAYATLTARALGADAWVSDVEQLRRPG